MRRTQLDFERLFFCRKTALVLGVAAMLAVGGIATACAKVTPTQLSKTGYWSLWVFSVTTSIGAITLFMAMWSYWVKCDRSSKWYRSIWFVVLLFGFFSGAPQVLYYMVVYLPGLRGRLQERQGERSV